MDRVQLTQVEILEKEHPGLQLYVDASFDRGINGAEISRGLRKKFGVSVSERVLYSYRRKRWVPTRDRVRKGIERVRFLLRIMEEVPERDARRALIYEHLFNMSLPELEQRDIDATHLDAQDRKLDIEDRRAKDQGKALRAKIEEATALHGRRQNRKAAGDEKADPAEIRRRIRGIFGLPDDRRGGAPLSPGTARPDQPRSAAGSMERDSAPAVPGEVAPR